MSYDGIDHLTGCGYSEREAAFLYIVAVHSGYFLRRQFNRFVSRERGAIATYFLRRATELNHITELPCAEGRRIYHLSDRQVYRLVGLDSSQGRRIKSPGEILRRLMTLDYVLRHLDGERFIETQEAKRQLFTQLRVRPEAIQDAESFRHLVPLSLVEGPESSAVHLAFLDEGQRSSSLFVRFLSTHAQLLRSLPVAEIIYVSTVTTQFMQARRLFERHTPLRNTMSPACPRGIEHLVSWLEVRHRFHERGGSISPSDHRLLLEGDGLYNAPIHKGTHRLVEERRDERRKGA